MYGTPRDAVRDVSDVSPGDAARCPTVSMRSVISARVFGLRSRIFIVKPPACRSWILVKTSKSAVPVRFTCECGKNGGVFFDRIAPAPLRAECQIAGALRPRQQRLVRLARRRIPRRPNDQAAYLSIDGEIIVELAISVIALHAHLKEAQTL